MHPFAGRGAHVPMEDERVAPDALRADSTVPETRVPVLSEWLGDIGIALWFPQFVVEDMVGSAVVFDVLHLDDVALGESALTPVERDALCVGVAALIEGKFRPRRVTSLADWRGYQLWVACARGDVAGAREALGKLQECGGELEWREQSMLVRTPLHVVAQHGHTEIAEMLINAGHDLNPLGAFESRPIHAACYMGAVGVVRLLCEAGADIVSPNNLGDTPFHTACLTNRPAILDILWSFNDGDINIHDSSKGGWQSIHFAAREGCLGSVERLIQFGADINALDDRRETPLCLAAQGGHTTVVERLLRLGARRDLCVEGNTPLHMAAREGHVAVARALAESVDDLNRPGKHGWTPLHYAASRGHVGMASWLVGCGADVLARDHRNATPAEIADQAGELELAAHLRGEF